MSEAAQLYTPEWHARHQWTQGPARRCLLEQFRLLGRPSSYLDVGCGTGLLVYEAAAMGVQQVAGLDIAATLQGTQWCDLAQPFNLDHRFQQVTCWEVAEHLPPERAAGFCMDLARHVGRWLVFTAAVPGQGGEGHLNEQPAEYWRAGLKAAGLHYVAFATDELRRRWEPVCGRCWWYPRNVQVFGCAA